MLKILCRRRLWTLLSKCSYAQITVHEGETLNTFLFYCCYMFFIVLSLFSGIGVSLIPFRDCNVGRPLERRQSFSAGAPYPANCSKMVVKSASVNDGGSRIDMEWNDGKMSRYHAVWLRHHCLCEECYSTKVNQVLIEVDKLPLEIKVKDVKIADDGRIQILWDDNHCGVMSSDFLRKYCYSLSSLSARKAAVKTSLYTGSTLPSVTWADCEADDKHVYRWLKNINEHGLGLIKGAPVVPNLVSEFIPKHLAQLLDNTYGKIYDVIAMEHPTNVAYTRSKLQFHTDLPYYESAPGIQFLHCLKFDVSLVGGETIFVDLFAVCEEFRQTNPVEFKTLTTTPCTFVRNHESRDTPIHLHIQRPVINLNNEHEIIGVFWSPVSAGVAEIAQDVVPQYYRAYQMFARAISNFHTKNEVRLQPGDLVAFNNRRMAHSRNSFSGGRGERHLQGCYVNICEYKSRLISLTKKYGNVSTIKRVGNMDWM
ncbi:gamma-butyrobetaine dioxygenase-like [Argopecten irradians]|uniref:gamma-butyrobetaine dioxygenase-like n=1 Tax=Argopecten irradians TaxID=31199 RepID=UPI00371A1983